MSSSRRLLAIARRALADREQFPGRYGSARTDWRSTARRAAEAFRSEGREPGGGQRWSPAAPPRRRQSRPRLLLRMAAVGLLVLMVVLVLAVVAVVVLLTGVAAPLLEQVERIGVDLTALADGFGLGALAGGVQGVLASVGDLVSGVGDQLGGLGDQLGGLGELKVGPAEG